MYTVHYAKTNLSKLLLQVEDGKHVVLARGKKPIARLVPCSHQTRIDQKCTVTSEMIKIVEKREIAGKIGDTVVYF